MHLHFVYKSINSKDSFISNTLNPQSTLYTYLSPSTLARAVVVAAPGSRLARPRWAASSSASHSSEGPRAVRVALMLEASWLGSVSGPRSRLGVEAASSSQDTRTGV